MAEASRVNNFDVLKRMGEQNRDVRLAPLGNVSNLLYTKKHRGTKVTIGVDGDVVGAMAHGRLVGGLILADKGDFDRTKAELEADLAAVQNPARVDSVTHVRRMRALLDRYHVAYSHLYNLVDRAYCSRNLRGLLGAQLTSEELELHRALPELKLAEWLASPETLVASVPLEDCANPNCPVGCPEDHAFTPAYEAMLEADDREREKCDTREREKSQAQSAVSSNSPTVTESAT